MVISQEQMTELLNVCYDKALEGLPVVSESIKDFGDNYIGKYGRTQEAIDKLIKNQILKCSTSGFLTGLGGLITLPVTIPANIGSVIYVQLRMIATIAYIRGYDPTDDEVRTLAYVCLTGTAMIDILKSTGIEIGKKLTVNLIKKIPSTVLIKINQKVGFRLVTKFGEKGIVNLGKMIPVIGGVVGGGVDGISTKIIAKNANQLFSDVHSPKNKVE